MLAIPLLVWGALAASNLFRAPTPCVPQDSGRLPESLAPPASPLTGGQTAVAPRETSEPSNPARRPAAAPVKSFRGPWTPIQVDLNRLIQIEQAVKKYAQAFRVDEDLVWAVIRQESGGNPTAVSPKGAMGLMQLMPDTAALMGVTNPFDVEQNIAGGIKYLESCLRRFDGEVDLALAAYNAGPENVVKYQGCPPFPETCHYVAAVLQNYSGTSPAGYWRPRDQGVALPAEIAAPALVSGLQWHLPKPVVKIRQPQWHIPLPRWQVVTARGKLQSMTAKSAGPAPPSAQLE